MPPKSPAAAPNPEAALWAIVHLYKRTLLARVMKIAAPSNELFRLFLVFLHSFRFSSEKGIEYELQLRQKGLSFQVEDSLSSSQTSSA